MVIKYLTFLAGSLKIKKKIASVNGSILSYKQHCDRFYILYVISISKINKMTSAEFVHLENNLWGNNVVKCMDIDPF